MGDDFDTMGDYMGQEYDACFNLSEGDYNIGNQEGEDDQEGDDDQEEGDDQEGDQGDMWNDIDAQDSSQEGDINNASESEYNEDDTDDVSEAEPGIISL